jgi:hypothetical protein
MLELTGANPGLSPNAVGGHSALPKPAATIAIDFWHVRECAARPKIVQHNRNLTRCLSEAELSALRNSLKKIYTR